MTDKKTIYEITQDELDWLYAHNDSLIKGYAKETVNKSILKMKFNHLRSEYKAFKETSAKIYNTNIILNAQVEECKKH